MQFYDEPEANQLLRDPALDLRYKLEPIVKGLGMSLIEVSLYRSKKQGASVQIKAVVLAAGDGETITGLEDCSRVHRAIMPRLELNFPNEEIYLEVSSPGIDRQIKDGNEFLHYLQRGVRCYCRDRSD